MATRGRAALYLTLLGAFAAGVVLVAWAAGGREPGARGGLPDAHPAAPAVAAAAAAAASGERRGAGSPADAAALVAADVAGAEAPREALPTRASGAPPRGAPSGSAGARAADTVTAGPPRTWRGRVLALATGEPVVDARVVLTHGDRQATTATDAEGRFALEWPADLDAALAILHPRFVDRRDPAPELGDDATYRLVASGLIQGEIRPWPPAGLAEGAAGSARLEPHDPRRQSQRDSGEEHAVDVSPDGRFAFLDVTPGAWNVAVDAPGAIVDGAGGVELAAGEARTVALTARAGGRVDGVVRVAPDRAPLAGAVVEVRGEPSRDEPAATTAADGAFELVGLAPGRHVLNVLTPWGAEERRSVDVPATREPIAVEIEVAAPARMAGRVVDAAETPVVGARVVLLGRGEQRELERALAGAAVGLETTTDAGGAFAFDRAPAGVRVTVLAVPADGAAGSLLAGPAEEGAAALDLLVRLPAGVPVAGRVLGDDGLPAEGVELELRAVHPRASAPVAHGGADPEGFFAFAEAPTGTAVIQAVAPGYRKLRQRVEVGPEGVRGVELVLPAAFRVDGRVVDAEGAGVAGVAVRVTIEEGSAEALALEEAGGRGMRRLDWTDAYGRFAFDGLAPGRWTPSLHAADYELVHAAPTVARVPGDADLVLEVRPSARPELGAVAGEVWARAGGEPAGLRITGLRRGAVLRFDGPRFEATGVTPGTLRLAFSADGYAEERRGPLELAPGARLELGRIELEPGTRLTVRVGDAEGERVGGATVRLLPLPAGGGGAAEGARPRRLDVRGKGVYRDGAVPRGAWRLRVVHPGFRTHQQTVQVRAADAQEVEVRLQAARDGAQR